MYSLIGGKKKYIKCDDVRVCFVPHYDGLSVEKILEWATFFEDVDNYMPDERDRPKLPRQWVCNVVLSVVGPDFQEWIA